VAGTPPSQSRQRAEPAQESDHHEALVPFLEVILEARNVLRLMIVGRGGDLLAHLPKPTEGWLRRVSTPRVPSVHARP
jgi:hypothetical protein